MVGIMVELQPRTHRGKFLPYVLGEDKKSYLNTFVTIGSRCYFFWSDGIVRIWKWNDKLIDFRAAW